MVDLAEHLDNTGVVNAGDEDGQQVGEEGGLFLQVEGERLVVTRRRLV